LKWEIEKGGNQLSSEFEKVGDLLPSHLKEKWAISQYQFTQPSWNILLRTLAVAGLLNSEGPIRQVEIKLLFQLETDQIRFMKHVGPARFSQLIKELQGLEHALSEPLSNINLDRPPELSKDEDEILEQIDTPSSLTLEQMLLFWIATIPDWRRKLEEEFGLTLEEIEFEDEHITRRIQIFDLRMKGMTLDQIGHQFGVTRERIRQIVKKAYLLIAHMEIFEGQSYEDFFAKYFESKKGESRQKALEKQMEIDLKVRKLLETSPGMTMNELANNLNLSIDELKNSLQPQTTKFIWGESKLNPKPSKYSEEDILEGLRMAEAFESPISAPMYWSLVSRGLIDAPGPQTVAIRFGSWRRACELAQVNYVESIRSKYESNWTEEEMLLHVIEFLKNRTFGRGIENYDAWRIETMNNAPSGALVRTSFGSWLEAKNLALVLMREKKISPKLIDV
jgi:lambda repressor-like predicted transcriptional regulator